MQEKKSRKIDLVITIAAIIMGIFLGWKFLEIIIFAVFVWIIMNPIKSRLLAGWAMFFLILTPILLLFKNKDSAENFAIYAYYFLGMAVIMGIYEIVKEEKNETMLG